MDGKQLLIPLCYNLESSILAPCSHACQQSNVGTQSKYQYMPWCTLPQQKFITGLCCPERDRNLQMPTMFRQFQVSLCPVAVQTRQEIFRHKWPGWILLLPHFPNKTLLPDSDLVSSSISNTGIDVREIYSPFQVQNFSKQKISDSRPYVMFPSSIAGVGNLLWDRCWMPCK
ncbi:hypothetical protein T4C_13175 [Trichinella pseudospiralis]|uniref:Uncharacterized protein n=1 Tax=Trichinella pseudospiralis TaxID=6337 RepID=A0A0V1JJT9_TRIPS|nr:hypothetical protein T4C_13175 [Trichinella pseudospiralis]